MVQYRLVLGRNSVGILSPEWKHPRPKPDTPDLMHSLPPELRNVIYALVLPTNMLLIFGTNRMGDIPSEPALLRVAKYIRVETSQMYHGNNNFVFNFTEVEGFLLRATSRWRRVVADCGERPFRRFEIWFGTGIEIDAILGDIYALVELIHDTGFEPDPKYVHGDGVRPEVRARSIASGTALFNTCDAKVLGRAVALARRARSEGWSKEKLRARFTIFSEVARRKGRKKWPACL